MKILIIDDDPLIAEMYTLKLKEAGFDVEVATDGRAGLEKIKGGNYDVVLLDVVLPIMDGFEILQSLQREGKSPPPVILLTNLGQKEDVDRGMALGAVDYVIKAHFTPTEVVAKIQAVLKKAQS
ncbi:MAG: response regulator transcription factor [Candidatus Sungbacteria bacterium]|uniref:Response regulator transcription factor n=1 Tax=Candidatus Sungiibacteriota bacterium TaxID=2750080 RepID=A0A933DTG1_9BACT|nr:response regulator transcription factor [Candidatus Sungbacteria bacterium]